MTTETPDPQPTPDTTEVDVETPAKDHDQVEVDAAVADPAGLDGADGAVEGTPGG